MIDFNGGGVDFYKDDPGAVTVVPSTSKGKIIRAYTEYNPYINGFRATFDVELAPGETSDLRAFLKAGAAAVSETWIFPWEAPEAAKK